MTAVVSGQRGRSAPSQRVRSASHVPASSAELQAGWPSRTSPETIHATGLDPEAPASACPAPNIRSSAASCLVPKAVVAWHVL